MSARVDSASNTELVIQRTGEQYFTTVKEQRSVEITPVNKSRVVINKLPNSIHSIKIASLTDQNATIRGITFENAKESLEDVLRDSIGKKFQLIKEFSANFNLVEGTVMWWGSKDKRILLKQDPQPGQTSEDDLVFVNPFEYSHIIPQGDFRVLAELEAHIKLDIDTSKYRRHDLQLTYGTRENAFTWRKTYKIVLSADETTFDAQGYFVLYNNTSMTYKNARVRLIDHSLSEEIDISTINAKSEPTAANSKTLVTLAAGRELQVPMVSISGVAFRKIVVFHSALIDDNNLGLLQPRLDPNLPPGSKESTTAHIMLVPLLDDENPEHQNWEVFDGEATLYKQLSPADSAHSMLWSSYVRRSQAGLPIEIWYADIDTIAVRRERKGDCWRFEGDRSMICEEFQLTVSGADRLLTETTVYVEETLFRWHDWRITKSNTPFKPAGRFRIRFKLRVAPESSTTVTYTVVYRNFAPEKPSSASA